MKLIPGDLIFWCSMKPKDSEPSLFEDAVSMVGGGPAEPFHVSLVVDNGRVVHAVSECVTMDNVLDVLDRFLNMYSKLKIVVASLPVSEEIKSKAVSFAKSKIGLPYNDTFSEDRADRNEAFYCCQLVRKSYLTYCDTLKFPMRPLNFRDSNNKLIPYWIDYFREKGIDVPEMGVGSHPADLLKSDIVTVLSTYYVGNKL